MTITTTDVVVFIILGLIFGFGIAALIFLGLFLVGLFWGRP